MKKYSNCGLLIGLMLLTGSCSNQRSLALQLRAVKPLPHFPSASAIEYAQNHFYLFGDDAPYMLVLDTALNEVDTIHYSSDTAYRVAKEVKADLESATLMSYQTNPAVVAFGSLSTRNRQMAYAFPLHDPHGFNSFSLHHLKQALENSNDLNIEGAAFVAGKLVLADRAHLQKPANRLFIVDTTQPFRKALPIAVRMKGNKSGLGISGLYYHMLIDRLLFTASEEATASAYADGAIGGSYLGWIDRFSTKMQTQTVVADGLIALHKTDKRFYRQKIEGLCAISSSAGTTELVLVADNDDGQSTLFKVLLYQ